MGYREGDPPEQSKLGQITGEEIWWVAKRYHISKKKTVLTPAFTKAESWHSAKLKFPFDCNPEKVIDEIVLALLEGKAIWHL